MAESTAGLAAAGARSTYWTVGGAFARVGAQLLVTIVLARLLTPYDFGVVSAALVVTGLSIAFVQIGVGPALVQRPLLTQTHVSTAFWTLLGLGAAASAATWVLADGVALFLQIPDLGPALRVLAIYFAFEGAAVASHALLQREMRFRALTLIEVGAYLFGYAVVGVALALLGFGVWALVFAQLCASFVRMVALMVMRRISLRPISGEALRQLLGVGVGYSLTSVGNIVATQGDNLVVGRLLGATALGAYSRAYQFLLAPTTLIGVALSKVLFPSMASIQDDRARLARAYRRLVGGVALFSLPLSTVGFLVAPELVRLLLGTQWDAVIVPFQILSCALIFRVGYKVSDALAKAVGAVYQQAWRHWAYASVIIIGAAVGGARGLPGVATGVSIALAVNYVLMADLARRSVGMRWRGLALAHLPALGLSLVIGLTTFAVLTLTRSVNAPEWVPFVLLAAALPTTAWLVLRLAAKRRVLGDEGAWVITTLRRTVPRRVRPLIPEPFRTKGVEID